MIIKPPRSQKALLCRYKDAFNAVKSIIRNDKNIYIIANMRKKAAHLGGGGRGAHPLHPPPRSAPGTCTRRTKTYVREKARLVTQITYAHMLTLDYMWKDNYNSKTNDPSLSSHYVSNIYISSRVDTDPTKT